MWEAKKAYLYPKSNQSSIYCDGWKKLQEMVRQSNGQSKPEATFLCAYYVLIEKLTTFLRYKTSQIFFIIFGNWDLEICSPFYDEI